MKNAWMFVAMMVVTVGLGMSVGAQKPRDVKLVDGSYFKKKAMIFKDASHTQMHLRGVCLACMPKGTIIEKDVELREKDDGFHLFAEGQHRDAGEIHLTVPIPAFVVDPEDAKIISLIPDLDNAHGEQK